MQTETIVRSVPVSPALAIETRDVAIELHTLFAELDRGRLKADALASMRGRLDVVRDKVGTLRAAESHVLASASPLGGELVKLDALLDAHAPARDRRADWLALRESVQPTYERLATALSVEDIHVPSLRPTNYARNVLHLASATGALLALELAPSWSVAIGIAATVAACGWAMEISRKFSPRVNAWCMALFGRTAHPHEAQRVNSATWYATAVLLIALARAEVPAAIALIVLGVGDPLAAIIGRRFGRIRLVHGRSLEGSLAFVMSGALAAFGFVLALHPEVGLGATIAASVAGALLGGLAELGSRRIDDNFSVPLAAFAAAYVALGLF